MKFIRNFLFLLFILGIQPLMAQLSSRHFMPPLKKSGSAAEFSGQTFYLSTPETTAFDVNIYQGTNTTPTATLSISNNSPGIYYPPLGTGGTLSYGNNNTSLVTDANAGIVLSTAGFRFEAPSGKIFYVNWRASHSAQASSLVSAGEAGLGTDFKWGGTPLLSIATGSFSNSSYDTQVNSVIGIMATEDNTHVSISGYNPACTFTNALGKNGITADVINITLNAGQTYVLEARPTGLTSDLSPNNDGWLGASITSDKKIALNQGHLLLSFNTGNLDMSMTQITPTSNIGKEYVFIRGIGSDKPEYPVIIATENNTEIFVNNETTPIAKLNDGQWIKIPSSKYSQSGVSGGFQGANMYIRATKNVYAFQTLDAGNNDNAPANADVFQVAPLNCLLDNGVNKIPEITQTGTTVLDNVNLMIMASSAINASDIVIKYGVGSVNTIPSTTLINARKTVSGTSDWVTYYVPIPAVSSDVSVYAPGPVAVAYLGYSGAVGVAGYFSGFGTIPTINVQTTGNGCFPNTTLTATQGFTTYAWYKDDVLLQDVTTNTYTPTIAGDYNVVVYNGFCTYPSAKNTVFDCNPEVVVKNTASKKFLLPGETSTFTISVKLLGGSAAQDLQISNLIPAHLTYTSSTVTKGTFSGSGSNFTWNIGTMSNGEENILTVVATAQSVTSAYAETYTANNTQTFALGTETNVLADDKTENVIIYPGCTSSLVGTILGATSYCTTTNTTTLTASNAVGDLQWQSSTDNTNFSDISGATASTLIVANLTSTTYYRVQATVDNCIVFSIAESITVSQGPAYSMTSATGSDAQSLCINTNIVPITYSTTNTTGATFSGLPSGVSGTWVNDIATISGTPSAAGTFIYTITITGSCAITITGILTVSNTNNTISLTSAAGTNAQSIDNNLAIATIIYNTTGATGASISGLPMGVTGTWTSNSISIAGTPSTTGLYNYTILLTGGCGSVTSTGTITVKGVTITSNLSGSSICSGSSVTFTATAIGFTSPAYQWFKNTVAISGATSATYTTTTLSNNDQISVSCINSPGIVNDNTLSLWLDAANASSYSGTGTTWTNIGTGGAIYNAAINAAHQTYSSNNGGYFEFDNTANPMLINKVTSAVTEVTMSTWVYITPGTTQGAFIKNGGSLGYTFGAGGGGGFCSSNFPGMLLAGQGWIGSYPPASNFLTGWQLCTMAISGLNPTTYKYYINGTLANTETFTGALAPSGNYTALGDNYGDGGACTTFNSKMGAAYIYTKALSNAEIIQNYNATASRFGLSTIGVAITSNTITTTVNLPPTVNVTVSGDACVNKTTLSTASGLTSYAWYKDNVAITGATSNIFVPTSAGDHKVQVFSGTCSTTSSTITISVCGLTTEGKMIPVVNSTTLVNINGAKNSEKGVDERGLILTKPIYYGTITTRTGRIWLDRNLGATRVALSPTDTQAYGDYFQWGRPADGHEKHIVSGISSNYTTVRSATSVPGNSNYIFPADGSFDWLTTADNTLWTGVNAPNNPCPIGFRIPTLAEWILEKNYFTSNDVNGSYENGYGLKLTTAGMGTSANGITGIGVYGQYLTQTAYSTGQVRYFGVISWTTWDDNNYYKTTGQSCRCIKD